MLLCMLLSLAACQKIDDGDIASSADKTSGGKSDDKESSSSNTNNNSELVVESNYHVLVYSAVNTSGETVNTYISQKEWTGIYSAFNEANAKTAVTIAEKYVEGGVTGWHIPTKEEVQTLKRIYNITTYDSSALDSLNTELQKIGAEPYYNYEANGKPRRYLCSNADSTFTLIQGNNILKAGATVKYNLRLLKDSIVTKQ